MHRIGTRARAVIEHVAGGTTVVADEPFRFGSFQYLSGTGIMQPGDAIRSECTFMNNRLSSVGYGQSTYAEMCYLFELSYPAGALDKDEASLLGMTNGCLYDE